MSMLTTILEILRDSRAGMLDDATACKFVQRISCAMVVLFALNVMERRVGANS